MGQSGRVRVYIATTLGPVEVEAIRQNPGAEMKPALCLGGTPEEVAASADYRKFASDTGALGRFLGKRSYRVELSGRIDRGESFGLGIYLAHALNEVGRLAKKGEPETFAILATGEVLWDLSVTRVNNVPKKLEAAADLFEQLRARNISLRFLCPTENAVADSVHGSHIDEFLLMLDLAQSVASDPVTDERHFPDAFPAKSSVLLRTLRFRAGLYAGLSLFIFTVWNTYFSVVDTLIESGRSSLAAYLSAAFLASSAPPLFLLQALTPPFSIAKILIALAAAAQIVIICTFVADIVRVMSKAYAGTRRRR